MASIVMGLGVATPVGCETFGLTSVLTGWGASFKLLANRSVNKTLAPWFGSALSISACAPGLTRMTPLVGTTSLKMFSPACAGRQAAAVTATITNPQASLRTSRIIR
jgi:hypothetical protein